MAAARAAETLRPAEERLVWDQFAAALATLDPALLPQVGPALRIHTAAVLGTAGQEHFGAGLVLPAL